jgi:hypothetical protein
MHSSQCRYNEPTVCSWHERDLGDVRFSAGYEGKADIGRSWRTLSRLVTTATLDPSQRPMAETERTRIINSKPVAHYVQRRRFRSFGRGHALQRIDLYPVRARAPSSHNRYSRVPKPESAGGGPNYYWAAKSHQSSRSPTASPRAR